MKPLLKTLAIIAFLALTTQTVRHAYMLWFGARESVLDKYDNPMKDTIARAASIDELLRRYDAVHQEADRARQQRREENQAPYFDRADTEPFKSEQSLRAAITDWERKEREVHEVRFYWSFGFLAWALGSVLYLRGKRWPGLALLIVAFSEFIYWTSPTYFGAAIREFDRLLIYKLSLCAIALVLLLVSIWRQRVLSEGEPSA